MGKRKTRAKPVQRKLRAKLPKTFDCPFCNQENSVECKMDRPRMLGEVHCTVCGIHFQTEINQLSEAVDVYSKWIDKCEDLRDEEEPQAGGAWSDDEQDE